LESEIRINNPKSIIPFTLKTIQTMAVMKVLEIMSESSESWDDATKKGIEKASESVRNIRSAYVQDHSVTVGGGKVKSYRVSLKITFEVE